MSRFSIPQDPVFQQLNASIGFDWRLGPYDVEQSRAHAKMLAEAGIISGADRDALLNGLDRVEEELETGRFDFRPDDEDIHMAMFTRAHALTTIERLQRVQSALVQLADRHLDWAMPGYTHLQRSQPVYLAHHLLAYFWMFRRDARRFEHVLG